MSKERILVVDDSSASRRIFTVLLEKEGYDVQSAADAPQALAALASFHPDLILMDILLPGVGGLELTRTLKLASATRNITIVALTACSTGADVEKALASGCDALITKPISARTFIPLVRSNLNRA